MSPAELSSIKWEKDGEMSAQDTWTLVKKTHQGGRARQGIQPVAFVVETHSLQTLQSPLNSTPFFAGGLVVDGSVGEVFVLTPPFEGGRRLEHSLT